MKEVDDKIMSQAISDVILERYRQVTKEGWTAEHDNQHVNGEMAAAAAGYAMNSVLADMPEFAEQVPEHWPWDESWWKPTTTRRDLVKAGALIIAEIERLDRLEMLRSKFPQPPEKENG